MKWTILALLKEAERFMAEKGVPSARLESEVLLAHALSFDRVQLYANYQQPVNPRELDDFRSLTLRRIRGEPSAYLTGTREFFSLAFEVSPAVLIPRPETEETVQMALDGIIGTGEGLRMADVGTGSGCIAITLLKLKKKLQTTATDISEEALKMAASNARRHGVEDRIRFLQGDLLAPIQDQTFHLITCNPPYVDPQGPVPYAREVAEHEPQSAVFTPPGEPLHHYRKVLEAGRPLLEPEGSLIMEIGAGMGKSLTALAENLGWRLAEGRRDLAGIERALRFKTAS